MWKSLPAVRRAGLRIRFLQSTDDRITQSGTQSFRTVDQIGNFVIFLPVVIDFSQRIVSMADVGADRDGIRENRFRIICQTGIQKQIGKMYVSGVQGSDCRPELRGLLPLYALLQVPAGLRRTSAM